MTQSNLTPWTKFAAVAWLLLLGIGQTCNAQFDVRFLESSYSVRPGGVFQATVVISPVPPGGLYSFGVRLSSPPEQARVTSAQSIQSNPILAHDGPRHNAPVLGFGDGFAAVKGTAGFFQDPRPVSTNAALVTFEVQDLGGQGSYELSLDFFNTLGPTEQVFVDGRGMVLDRNIRFGSATVNRVARPPPEGDILIVRGRPHPEIDGLAAFIGESSVLVRDPVDGIKRPPVVAVGDASDLRLENLLRFQVIIWDDIDGSTLSIGEAEIEALWQAWRFGVRLYLIGTDITLSSRDIAPEYRELWTKLTGLGSGRAVVGPGMIEAREPRDRASELFSGLLDETRPFLIPDMQFSATTSPGVWTGEGEPRASLAGRPVLIRHPPDGPAFDGTTRRMVQAFPVIRGMEAAADWSRMLFLNAVAWLLNDGCDNFFTVPDGYSVAPPAGSDPCTPHVLHAVLVNNGRCLAPGVVLTNIAPAGFVVVGARILSDPPGVNSGVVLRQGRQTVFALGQVYADTSVEVQVDVLPGQDGPYTSTFTSSALYRQTVPIVVAGEAIASVCAAPRIEIRHGLLGMPEIRVGETGGDSVKVESSTDLKLWKLEEAIPSGIWVPVGELFPAGSGSRSIFLRTTF